MSAVDDFMAAIAAAGLVTPDHIVGDGKVHRFSSDGRPRDDAGWYWFHDDERPHGEFGCHRAGIKVKWSAKSDKVFTPEEQAAWRAKRERQDRERAELRAIERAEALTKIAGMLKRSTPANGHPYLKRKGIVGINGSDIRELDGELLIPMQSGPGAVTGLQRIDTEGGKKFIAGQEKKGCYHRIGKPNGTVVIAEGFATGASVHIATGHCVVIAFDAGNLEPVACKIREKMPEAQIIIAGDDDAHKEKNRGRIDAERAAAAAGARAVFPVWVDAERGDGKDFNDLHQTEGLEAVRQCFGEQEPPPEEFVDNETGEITSHIRPQPAPYKTAEQIQEINAAAQFTGDPLNLFAEMAAPAIKPGMLPDPIARYALDQAALLGVSPAMIAMPAIVSCAAVIHDGIEIQPKRHETGWRESARLWGAVVGAPSVRKSPSLKRATSRLRKINRELCDGNAVKQAQHAQEIEAWKDEKKQAKKDLAPAPAAPEEPRLERLIVEDVTVEALSEILKHNERGVLCIQDELTGWFGAMDAYNSGKGPGKDRAHWLEIYNGGWRSIDRVTRGSISIPNWSACMVGGIQPEVIRGIANKMEADGLLQRFMVVIGANTGNEEDRPEDADAKRGYTDLIDHLYGIGPGANPVILSEDAHQIRESLTHYADQLSKNVALPSGLKSHLGKWSGLFARLLLTYHVIDCAMQRVHPTALPVSAATATKVDALMRDFLLPHALAFYTDVLGGDSDLEHVRWIAGHILSKRLTRIENRDLLQGYKAWRGLTDWHKARIFGVLEQHGWITPDDAARTTSTTKGYSNKPPVAWIVNQKAHDLYANLAEIEREARREMREQMMALSVQH